MTRASIRLRLTAWYGSLMTATIAGLGIAVSTLMGHSLLRRVDEALDFEFAEAAERWSAGHPAEGLVDAPAAFHEAYLLRVLGPDGELLAQSPDPIGRLLPAPPGLNVGEPPAHSSMALGERGRFRVATGAVGSGVGRRVIQIAVPLAPYERELAELQEALWTILPVGLTVATIGGYWLAGRALAPVGRMTEAARRISAANLGERIAEANADDELGRLAATLNAMLDRIDREFTATQRFTADAAHELRTPLASIRTEAEACLIAPRTRAHYEDTLRSIVEEAERLSRLADHLLALSSEDSRTPPPRSLIRLDESVREAVRHATAAATRAGVSLQFEDLPAVVVEGDRDSLRQVFDNLLDNAIKYTPAGGAATVRGRLVGGLVAVEVRDSGVGIPGEDLPRIFDRFYRADPSRNRRTGGTGLGLSIVRAVIERHGGTVEATSEPGRGSTFRVVLPASPVGVRD